MREDRGQMLVQGLVAGLLGYATVAIFFVVENLIAGRSPLYTAAVLGQTMFYGGLESGRVAIEPGPILAYNGVHMVASVIVGLVASWLVFETERHHPLWYFLFFVFLAGFIYSLVAIGILGAEIANAIEWWSVAVANLAWVLAMGAYLLVMHRGLLRELREEEG